LSPKFGGLPFEGGFYGGKIQPRRQEDLRRRLGAQGARRDQMIWLPSYKDVPNARSCFHSMDNTRAMAEAGSPLAQWALGLDIDGRKDWCIPARDVLELGTGT
jgi:hypothetical protein